MSGWIKIDTKNFGEISHFVYKSSFPMKQKKKIHLELHIDRSVFGNVDAEKEITKLKFHFDGQ